MDTFAREQLHALVKTLPARMTYLLGLAAAGTESFTVSDIAHCYKYNQIAVAKVFEEAMMRGFMAARYHSHQFEYFFADHELRELLAQKQQNQPALTNEELLSLSPVHAATVPEEPEHEEETASLLQIAKDYYTQEHHFRYAIESVCRTLGQVKAATHIGFWSYQHQRSPRKLVCLNEYCTKTGKHHNHDKESPRDGAYEELFNFIQTGEGLSGKYEELKAALPEAFVKNYLDYYDVRHAVLMPFYIEGIPAGLVTFEKRKISLKAFSAEDIKRAEELTGMAALAYQALSQKQEDDEIRKMYKLMLDQNRQLRLMQQEMVHKNKRITDSINYAKRIQDAMLPSDERFRTAFSDFFIYFKPLDVVSGDFYWLSRAAQPCGAGRSRLHRTRCAGSFSEPDRKYHSARGR